MYTPAPSAGLRAHADSSAEVGTGWPPVPPHLPADRPAAATDFSGERALAPTGPAPSAASAAGERSTPRPVRDRSGTWLRNATAGLCVLASASAAVSFAAQYRMVFAARGVAVVAALEAGIPDTAALIFASLGVALALHGRRAIRARILNLTAVAASVFMNILAARPGWQGLAIWAMPPVAYALASDTLIGVVRAWAIARHRALNERLADDGITPLAVLGGLLLWLLRLSLAPASTLAGFRAWVITECPVAPGRRTGPRYPVQANLPKPLPAGGPQRRSARAARGGTKTGALLALVAERHGPLAGVPLAGVSRICTELAPQVGLDTGAARTALRKAVLAAQQEGSR